MDILVREATEHDADEGSLVLRRSITELCIADHGNDRAFLDGWLRNKTPSHFRAWLAQRGNALLVAAREETIVGVGAVTDAGEITLNYVSPDARFCGVSKTLLKALEDRAALGGCDMCTLRSSETARHFYLAHGYVEHERVDSRQRGYPMSKPLLGRRS